MNTHLFHNSLKLIGNSSFIELNSDSWICSKNSQTKFDLNEKIRILSKYLDDQKEKLNITDIKNLELIKEKFSKEANNEQCELIQTCISHFIRIAKSNHPKPSDFLIPRKIHIQISCAPQSLEELLSNLWLTQEYFPRYMLGNDLSVYDTAYDNLPENTDVSIIRENLSQWHQKHQQLKNSLKTKSLFEALDAQIKWLKNTLKPIKCIQMVVLIEMDVYENGALYNEAVQAIEAQIPLVLTRQLFRYHFSAFINFSKKVDVYIQYNGNLLLILPQGRGPILYGFSEKEFKKNSIKNLQYIENLYCNFAKNLNDILLNDSEDQGFYRIVYLSGHGLSHSLKNNSYIAGLKKSVFRKTLQILCQKNLVFLGMSSCYISGDNSKYICLKDGTLPCPMYFNGITDFVSFTENSYPKRLQEAEKSLFKKNTVKNFLIPNSLTLQDMEKIIGSSTQNDFLIHNWETYLFPRKNKFVPISFYIKKGGREILNLNKVFTEHCKQKLNDSLKLKFSFNKTGSKANQNTIKDEFIIDSSETENIIIKDQKNDRLAYLFSLPTFFAKLIIPKQFKIPIFLSTGGNAHHAIKEIEAPDLSLESFLTQTFCEPIVDREEFNVTVEPAFKVFAIGKLTCKFLNKRISLHEVVITQSPENCCCLFKLVEKGEYILIPFKKIEELKNGSKISKRLIKVRWMLAPPRKISEFEAIIQMFNHFFASTPYQKRKNLYEGEDSQFYEALNQFFWFNKPPFIAKLFQAINQDFICLKTKWGHIFRTTNFRSLLNEYRIAKVERPIKQAVLKAAFLLALELGYEDKATLLEEALKTPLMKAVYSNNPDLCQAVLEREKKTIDYQDMNGNTALHLAVIHHHYDAVYLLLKAGASIHIKNNIAGVTALNIATAYYDYKMIKIFIEDGIVINDLHFLCEIFSEALENDDKSLMLAILDKVNLVDFFIVAGELKERSIIDALLKDNKIDINSCNARNETLLFKVLSHFKTKDRDLIEHLLHHGANIDQEILDMGQTILHYAIQESKKKRSIEAVLGLLIEKSNKIDAQDEYKNTPLHIALEEKLLSVAKKLIKRKARVDLPNKESKTAITILSSLIPYLFEKDELDFLYFLFSQNVKLYNEAYVSGLCFGILGKNEKAIELFLSTVSDVNILDELGYTPLHYAVSLGNIKLITELIDKGALNYSLNDNDKTPLETAVFGAKNIERRPLMLEVVKVLVNSKLQLQEEACCKSILIALEFNGKEFVKLLINKIDLVNYVNNKFINEDVANRINVISREV